jgi:hypothetical protein
MSMLRSTRVKRRGVRNRMGESSGNHTFLGRKYVILVLRTVEDQRLARRADLVNLLQKREE